MCVYRDFDFDISPSDGLLSVGSRNGDSHFDLQLEWNHWRFLLVFSVALPGPQVDGLAWIRRGELTMLIGISLIKKSTDGMVRETRRNRRRISEIGWSWELQLPWEEHGIIIASESIVGRSGAGWIIWQREMLTRFVTQTCKGRVVAMLDCLRSSVRTSNTQWHGVLNLYPKFLTLLQITVVLFYCEVVENIPVVQRTYKYSDDVLAGGKRTINKSHSLI